MKIKHLLFLAGAAAFSSCSTAYRSGQTPDDVYYSPAPQQDTYVSTATEQDKNSYSYRNNEEQEIRRGIDNPIYRSPVTLSLGMGYGYSPYSLFPYNRFDNPFYGYDAYGYDPYGLKGMYDPYYNSIGYNNLNFYASPYGYYNSFPLGYGYNPYYGYSPYYSPLLFSSKTINTNTGARRYNLNVYNNNSGSNSGTGRTVQPIRSINTGTTQQPASTGVGNVIRRVFTPSERRTYTPPSNNSRSNTRRTFNNNNSRTYSNNNSRTYNNNNDNRTYNNNNDNNNTPQRSFSPSTNSSSSSSGSSNSAPVRTFRR